MSMTLNEYQELCDRQDGSVMYPSHGEENEEAIEYCLIALAGEVGEMLNKWKKLLRGDPGKTLDELRPDLQKELGGAFWYLAMAALELNISLEQLAKLNLDTIDSRLKRGTLRETETTDEMVHWPATKDGGIHICKVYGL